MSSTLRQRSVRFAGAAVVALACATAVAGGYSRLRHPRTGAPLVVPGAGAGGRLLHNGWRITPAGTGLPVGDMPLCGAVSPDGRLLAVTTSGFNRNYLHILDTSTQHEVAAVPLGRSWCGTAWAPAGARIYVSGGVSDTVNDIWVVSRQADGEWRVGPGIRLPKRPGAASCVSGIAVSPDGGRLFAVDDSTGLLYVLGAATGTVLGAARVGDHPVCCRLTSGGRLVLVADWGGASVVFVNVAGPAPLAVATVHTGGHPNDIALGPDGRAYVSCGNSDCVSVIDVAHRRVEEAIRTGLTARAPEGATPVSVAAARDGHTLYVANADNNDVAVVDTRVRMRSRVLGFVPTAWYPTCVVALPYGRFVVGSGKGTGTRPNPAAAPINTTVPSGFQYIGTQLNGTITFLHQPQPRQLARWTSQVRSDCPYSDADLTSARGSETSVLPMRVGVQSPIRYVLYVIKENRTYDQVFGDDARGNGDPALCLFGRDVTPNQHALAEQFVLLDNLYCNGEVSADGHPWCDAAYCTDFSQRAWVMSYSMKGNLAETPSVDTPAAGYIWDNCERHGIPYRSYGEGIGSATPTAEPRPGLKSAEGLAGHESEAFIGRGWTGKTGMRDTDRADVFIRELHEFERVGRMPQFMIMSLGENHTRGTLPGWFTPKACVASNDLALGRIVEALSHSRFWPHTAIFVIEDDAQNGPDHVDSHRTAGLLISPYTVRHSVDSTFYTTASMVRTMELALGLPPMSEYDAAATPMFASLGRKPDLAPFTTVPETVDVNARNSTTSYAAAESARMDWSGYDRVDEQALNRILWRSVRGVRSAVPVPMRSVAITTSADERRGD